jgi:hypothetical protein
MLVGRSSEGGGTLGWSTESGIVDDDASAYSLGALAHDASFTEVLVAARTQGSRAAIQAVRYALTDEQLVLAGNATISATTVVGADPGPCDLGAFAEMSAVGQIDRTDAFFFAADDGDVADALFATGWSETTDTVEGPCTPALLDGEHGVVYVR